MIAQYQLLFHKKNFYKFGMSGNQTEISHTNFVAKQKAIETNIALECQSSLIGQLHNF